MFPRFNICLSFIGADLFAGNRRNGSPSSFLFGGAISSGPDDTQSTSVVLSALTFDRPFGARWQLCSSCNLKRRCIRRQLYMVIHSSEAQEACRARRPGARACRCIGTDGALGRWGRMDPAPTSLLTQCTTAPQETLCGVQSHPDRSFTALGCLYCCRIPHGRIARSSFSAPPAHRP